jgi:hypothetical protein
MIENSILGHIIVFLAMFVALVVYELGKIYLKEYRHKFRL